MKLEDITKQHRTIGIRHTLKKLKEKGLVDDETLFAEDAATDIQVELLRVARRWYRIGARRGAIETINAILKGQMTVREEDGQITIVANSDMIKWKKSLTVSTGNEKAKIKAKKYSLKVVDHLGFE